jgi:hypothetical protein
MSRVIASLCVVLLSVVGEYARQAPQTAKPASGSVKPQAVKKDDPPTLGFNRIKDVSPIVDEDAYMEELKLEKQLPGNQFVHVKRAMHEAALMNDFVDGFKNSKECNGITLYLKTDKNPAFTVQITISGHDDHPSDQTWTWILGYPGDPSSADSGAHGMGGMGSQSNAKLTARDVCLTVWDDIDPNHFKKPGGKVE